MNYKTCVKMIHLKLPKREIPRQLRAISFSKFFWCLLPHGLWHDLWARTIFTSSYRSLGFYLCFTCASESSGSSQSLGPGADTKDDSHANSKHWDSAEVKILVAAYKAYNNDLKSVKSRTGKKAICEKIYASICSGEREMAGTF